MTSNLYNIGLLNSVVIYRRQWRFVQ